MIEKLHTKLRFQRFKAKLRADLRFENHKAWFNLITWKMIYKLYLNTNRILIKKISFTQDCGYNTDSTIKAVTVEYILINLLRHANKHLLGIHLEELRKRQYFIGYSFSLKIAVILSSLGVSGSGMYLMADIAETHLPRKKLCQGHN